MNEQPQRPFVHFVVYGDPGTEKSTFFATGPKPMLVLALDPYGKEAPYLRRGTVDATRYEGAQGQPITLVKSRRDSEATIVQLEYFHESDPEQPRAWLALKDRMPSVRAEVFAGQWASVVFDGVTMAEIVCRNYHANSSHSPLRDTKEPRRWFGATTDDLERLLVMQFGSFPCNVFISAHVDTDKDEVAGAFVHTPALPGRLRNRKELAAAYPEVFHSFAVRDAKTGVVTNWLQTQVSDRFHAMSSFLKAPDPCRPDFEAVFANWKA